MPSLSLYMNQTYVGELIQQPNGAHQLSYATSWLKDKKSRPLSLSLPLQKGKINSEKVFNFFDNLLPDSRLVRQRIMQRFTARSNRPFDLLSHIGRDSVGAITLLAEPLPPMARAEKPELQFAPLRLPGYKRCYLAISLKNLCACWMMQMIFVFLLPGRRRKLRSCTIKGNGVSPKG